MVERKYLNGYPPRIKQAICKKVSSNELSNILNQLERSGNIDALSRFYSTKYSGDPLRKTYEEMIFFMIVSK